MKKEKNEFTAALLGNPNSGKTTLFNSLTGATAYVGNWPGVTVEKRSGEFRFKKGGSAEIVDLPGIYSLSPYSPEEEIARSYIIDSRPDVVIDVVDCTNLQRNLYLTTQVLETDVPVVIALNMTDALKKEGKAIDASRLSKVLGARVVAISALKGEGLDELMAAAKEAAKEKRKGSSVLPSSDELKEALSIYSSDESEVSSPLFHSIKALERDELEKKANPRLYEKVDKLVEGSGIDYETWIADERYKFIERECSPCLEGKRESEREKLSFSDKVDRVLTNRWAGIPIFVAILFIVFHIVFSEDFLYLSYTGAIQGTFAEGTMWEGLFYADGALMSPGVIMANFVNCLTGGLSGVVGNWLSDPSLVPLRGFICDGILGGLFAVIGFLPQILFLFFFFSILEDSGYMARVAFIFDRIFRRFGLSGRSLLPMIMGFGCSVPAIMNTRTLNGDKERIKTIRVIPFFSCMAKAPILSAVAGTLSADFGWAASDLVALSVYLLGILVAIISVVLMHLTTQREAVPPFVMELPSYHLPQPRALAIHIYDKAKHFFKKAFTIIFLTTIAIWVLSHFSWDYTYLENNQINVSILSDIGRLIQPLFTPLGFGVQLGTAWGWAFAVTAITGLIAKENVIMTMAYLGAAILQIEEFGGSDAEAVGAVVEAITLSGGVVSSGALFAFIMFNVLTVPCFAAVATARSELPSGKIGSTLLFWLLVSYLGGTAFYLMIDWPWTIAIVVALLAAAFAGAFLYDRRKSASEKERA